MLWDVGPCCSLLGCPIPYDCIDFRALWTSFAMSLRAWISDVSKFSSSPTSATKSSPFQILPHTRHAQEDARRTFLPNRWCLDWSFAKFGWYCTIDPKKDHKPTECFSKTPFPPDKILNVSQTTFTFHGICPPFFIHTKVQKCRGCFSHPAYCPLCNTICLRSMRRPSTMIP